ncbi:hypothetical protein RclHR1_05640012 [Rhizophagus clarus]|uniref:Uncharacterized protein n=1 Tax=Rhizophagus clarus TaxID=94130 RepID=A0A2Z6SGC5_9GLOM|nr:hypothetical protein RclHR1_05640012 [Rhizophagus clarus]
MLKWTFWKQICCNILCRLILDLLISITNFHITGFTAHFYTVKGKKDRDKLASPFYLPTILSSAFVSFCNITYINEWGVFLKYSF